LIKYFVSKGEHQFFVTATCVTTLAGAYDPIDEMAEICKKYYVWLHADGSFGGSLILSDKYRHLMKGIEKTDSFAWNPQPLLQSPLRTLVLSILKGSDYKGLLLTDYVVLLIVTGPISPIDCNG